MKKFFMAALAVCAAFASCSKDDNGGLENEAATLTIKLSGVVQSGTRAIEAPGSTDVGTIQLGNGYIFVLDAAGTVKYHETLDVDQAASATGQVLGAPVSSSSRVYVIGNIPAAETAAVAALTSWTQISAYTSLLTTQTDYTTAALANSTGAPVTISVTGTGTATANVSIKPLISRIELVQVKGGANITSFTVSGVYVDDYYPSFTYAGSYSGTMFSQAQATTFTGIGDAGTWAAAGSPSLVAKPELSPASGEVWAQNVAAGGLPRLIIALEDVKYKVGSNPEVVLTGTHYLTVTGYDNGALTAFERGKIYRIGGMNGIEFTEDDISITPNPTEVTLTLFVDIEEWELVTPNANL